MPPAVAPPQKKGRGCLFWAVLAIVLLVLLVGGCGIVGYLLIRGPIDGTNEFLAEVADGDYAGAEALVAPGCALSAAQIEADLGGLTDYQIFLASTGTGEINRTGGTVTINGELLDFTAQVEDTDEGWRVCSYAFDELLIGS